MIESTSQSIHQTTRIDVMLVESIESHRFQLAEFSHAVHLKLAYFYLVTQTKEQAYLSMERTLRAFLEANGVDKNKFHLTLTHAWLELVWQCLQSSHPMPSADAFVQQNPGLLNKDLLSFYYSHDLLFSDRARKQFVEPDLNAF